MITADELAKFFHETYERLAPSFGYETREASAKPWEDVPEKNKRLMVAVSESVIAQIIEPVELVARTQEQKVQTMERRLAAVQQAIDPRFDTSRMVGETT